MILDVLETIAGRLAQRKDTLGLLALGSAGRETDRLDEHSDLDFFVIAKDKHALLDDLTWLGTVQWAHRDTPDGCKALVDGVFCEFAVFEPQELPGVAFTPGRFVWRRPECPNPQPSTPPPVSRQWLEAEILSNLFVGLHRWLRGERLAAMHMVQGQALGNLCRLYGAEDPFDPTRRVEGLGLPLADLAPGYAHTPQAAASVLAALDPPPGPMLDAVNGLLQRAR